MSRSFVSLSAALVALSLSQAHAQESDGPSLIILDVTDDSRRIVFDEPLETDDPALAGKTIAELIDGSPPFAPIEGLPPEVWKDKHCSDCHNWERETLCAQGQSYQTESGAASLAKVHPYGGGFKATLRRWADQGCN